MLTIEYDARDLEKLNAACSRASALLQRDALDMARMGMRFALQTAAKETPVHKGSKFRPIVKWSGPALAFFTADSKGRMFPPRSQFKNVTKDGRLARVRYAREAWLKGERKEIPLASVTRPARGEGKAAKIPHIGYARLAWRKMIPLFGFQELSPGKSAPFRASIESGKGTASARAENLSTYAPLIAPGAVSAALRSAENRMSGYVKSKMQRLSL